MTKRFPTLRLRVLQRAVVAKFADGTDTLKQTRQDMISLREDSSLGRPAKRRSQPGPVRSYAGLALICGAIAVLAGCGGGTTGSPVQVGPIAFTDINGNALTDANGKPLPPITSLKVGAGSYLDAVVKNDPQQLGINWSVTCSSALPPGTPLPPGETVDESCGTFTAVHTATAPVPSYATSGAGVVTFYQAPTAVPSNGTVTLTAAATVDPSVNTSLTLTIIGIPISVGFAPGPPASLAVNATAQVGALVSNDPSAGGVKWTVTCASIACGSFSATQTANVTQTTYTAPDAVPVGGTVTITATSVTDPTKFVSAEVTVTQAATASLEPGHSEFSASAGMLLARLQGESR